MEEQQQQQQPPQQWTLDEELSQWLAQLVESHQQAWPALADTLSASPSYTMTNLQRRRADERSLCKIAHSLHSKIRLDKVNKWLLPVNVNDCHWVLLAVMPREHVICVYDSLAAEEEPKHTKTPPASPRLLESADAGIHTLDGILRLLMHFLVLYGQTCSVPHLARLPWRTLRCRYATPQRDQHSCAIYCLLAALLCCRSPIEVVYDVTLGNPVNLDMLRERARGLATSSKERVPRMDRVYQ